LWRVIRPVRRAVVMVVQFDGLVVLAKPRGDAI